MDQPSLWQQIGVNLSDLVAGFAGGVVNAFVFKRAEAWAIVGSVVVGALMANYLSPIVGRYLGTSGGASGFVTGLAGMALAQGIVSAAGNWRVFYKDKNNV